MAKNKEVRHLCAISSGQIETQYTNVSLWELRIVNPALQSFALTNNAVPIIANRIFIHKTTQKQHNASICIMYNSSLSWHITSQTIGTWTAARKLKRQSRKLLLFKQHVDYAVSGRYDWVTNLARITLRRLLYSYRRQEIVHFYFRIFFSNK